MEQKKTFFCITRHTTTLLLHGHHLNCSIVSQLITISSWISSKSGLNQLVNNLTMTKFSLVDTGLLVHWLVLPSRTEFSFVHLRLHCQKKKKYHSE